MYHWNPFLWGGSGDHLFTVFGVVHFSMNLAFCISMWVGERQGMNGAEGRILAPSTSRCFSLMSKYEAGSALPVSCVTELPGQEKTSRNASLTASVGSLFQSFICLSHFLRREEPFQPFFFPHCNWSSLHLTLSANQFIPFLYNLVYAWRLLPLLPSVFSRLKCLDLFFLRNCFSVFLVVFTVCLWIFCICSFLYL